MVPFPVIRISSPALVLTIASTALPIWRRFLTPSQNDLQGLSQIRTCQKRRCLKGPSRIFEPTEMQSYLSLPFICMDDFHYSDMIVDGPEFQGFIDLEMSRYGNEIMVLAAVLASISPRQLDRWSWIRQGYENGRGRTLDNAMIALAAKVAPFTRWVRFMWYWSTDDIP